MIPELTLGTAVAGLCGVWGATFAFWGIRLGNLEDTTSGAILLLLAWGVLEVGALL